MNRRQFVTRIGTGMAALPAAQMTEAAPAQAGLESADLATSIDHRYTPLSWQTAFGYPDDPFKSLVGERGELRYGHPGPGKPIDYFPTVVAFSLLGMEADQVAKQRLESAGIPVIHTHLARPEANLHLTTFATNQPAEGRVDNVMVEVTPVVRTEVHAGLVISIRTRQRLVLRRAGGITIVHADAEPDRPFLVTDAAFGLRDTGSGYLLTLVARTASGHQPLRCLVRFPQQHQSVDQVAAGIASPGPLLAAARAYWRGWRAFGGEVEWKLAGPYQDFLLSSARNIQQAREVVQGKTTFQVGPTVYRSLFVVDGHFLLEAARYLGYDTEAQKGLETTWTYQDATSGGVFAGAGKQHWKDTGIAMFSLVRQAELSQDWSYFRRMQPAVLRGVAFLADLREKARAEGSANGRYGLLARGMGDGGLGGIRSEFTNTIWALAGLKAVVEAAGRLQLGGYEPAVRLHREMQDAFFAAAKQEMRTHPDGFEYLPMLMKEDAQWNLADEWERPRVQVAQWAMAHAIYPGMVFEKSDPIVRGFVRLMQAVTQEDVPAETGWLPHEGLWTYNAAFVSHVYLWANEPEWARLTFTGFLNHSTPLYCWREEQPLRNSLVCSYVGDMPHNWASAECVLYLRHMLALEDGPELRLLAGFSGYELDPEQPYELRSSPSRFGRLRLKMEPLDRKGGWRLEFARGAGPRPGAVALPAAFGDRLKIAGVEGASYRQEGMRILIDPDAAAWSAIWKS